MQVAVAVAVMGQPMAAQVESVVAVTMTLMAQPILAVVAVVWLKLLAEMVDLVFSFFDTQTPTQSQLALD
jgi:hypothetical protein